MTTVEEWDGEVYHRHYGPDPCPHDQGQMPDGEYHLHPGDTCLVPASGAEFVVGRHVPVHKDEIYINWKDNHVTMGWAGRGFHGDDINTPRHHAMNASVQFLKASGIDNPTADAVEQLTDVFLPCLKIMCDRGYDPDGGTWKEGGWRSQLVDVRKKFARLWRHGWLEGRFVPDHSLDLINYTAFYHRLKMQGKPWGEWGEPEEGKR